MELQTVATLIREGTKLISGLLRSSGGFAQSPTPHDEPKLEHEQKTKGLTTAETIQYQKREIVKELTLLEGHLQQGCKINSKACDCCARHPIKIEGLAQETMSMTSEPIFRELADWTKSIAEITSEAASASGKYDEKYPELAIKARDFRKAIMPTEKEV